MSVDVKEITKAWIDSYFGTIEQKNRANDRNEICQQCPSLKEFFKQHKNISVQQCGECGCPISKKIWSYKFNACPLGKWEDVDKKHKNLFDTELKTKNTI